MLAIFDCDGVLVDSEPISNRLLAEHLTEIGLPMSAEESMELFMGRPWAANQLVIEERLGRPLPDGFRTERTERMRAAAERELRAVDGIAEVLAAHDGPRCVASSAGHRWMEFALGLTGLLEHFPRRFSAEDVSRGKPFPDLFLFAARSMGFRPQECVVIEDSPAGVEAARAAGMRCVGYRIDADERVEDMRELRALVSGV